MNVGLATMTMTIWRRSRFAATLLRRQTLPLRTGTPVFVGFEADSEVKKEIVHYVGHWEEIVDASVPLRSLDADLGDSRCFRSRSPGRFRSMGVRVPPDTEEIIDGVRGVPVPQIREADSVVPQITEEIVEEVQLVDVGSLVPQITEEMGERVQDRTPEHGIPVPQIVEERVQNRTLEQIVDVPLPPIKEVPVDTVLSTPQERAQKSCR